MAKQPRSEWDKMVVADLKQDLEDYANGKLKTLIKPSTRSPLLRSFPKIMGLKYKFTYSRLFFKQAQKIVDNANAAVAREILESMGWSICAALGEEPFSLPRYAYMPDFRVMDCYNGEIIVFYRVIEDEQLVVVHRIYHIAQDYQEDVVAEGNFWPLPLKFFW